MPEEMSGSWNGEERRSGIDRRLSIGRRRDNRGIRAAPLFRAFLNRRSGEEQRSGQDQRQAAPTDA